jgi:hypothetical protein
MIPGLAMAIVLGFVVVAGSPAVSRSQETGDSEQGPNGTEATGGDSAGP